MSFPKEVKEYYKDAYESALRQGNTSLSLLEFVKQEKERVLKALGKAGIFGYLRGAKNKDTINWIEKIQELRRKGDIPKYISLETLQKIAQTRTQDEIEKVFDYPENTQVQSPLLQHVAVPRSDDLITSQSDTKYSFIIEWISNAIDASSPHKQIGRFGEGFFQSLGYLEEENSSIEVQSKTAHSHGYQVGLQKRKGKIFVAPGVSQKQNIGTDITLKKILSSQEQQEICEYISQKFSTNTRAKIYLNGKQVNQLGDFSYINSEIIPDISRAPEIHIHIEKNGIQVQDTGIGMDSQSLSQKLLYPNTTTKKREKMSDEKVQELSPKETRFFYKGKISPAQKTRIALQVAGVVIEEFHSSTVGNIGECIFEFPSFSPLEDSRNEIKLSRETTISLVSALKKISQKSHSQQEKLGLLEVIGALYHHLKNRPSNIVDEEFSLETQMKKSFRAIQEELEKQGICILPALERVINTFGVRKDIFYIDPDFVDFKLETIPGVMELSESIIGRKSGKNGKKYRFFEGEFDINASHDYLIYEGNIFINKKTFQGKNETERDTLIQVLNTSINLNTSYELASERVSYGRLPTRSEGVITAELIKQEKRISIPQSKGGQEIKIPNHQKPIIHSSGTDIQASVKEYDYSQELAYIEQELNDFETKYVNKLPQSTIANRNMYLNRYIGYNFVYQLDRLIVTHIKNGMSIEDIITQTKVNMILGAKEGISISNTSKVSGITHLLLEFLERKSSTLTIPTLEFLSEVFQKMPDDIDGFIRYTETLLKVLEQDPKGVISLMDSFIRKEDVESEIISYLGNKNNRRLKRDYSAFGVFGDILKEKRKIQESQRISFWNKKSIQDFPRKIFGNNVKIQESPRISFGMDIDPLFDTVRKNVMDIIGVNGKGLSEGGPEVYPIPNSYREFESIKHLPEDFRTYFATSFLNPKFSKEREGFLSISKNKLNGEEKRKFIHDFYQSHGRWIHEDFSYGESYKSVYDFIASLSPAEISTVIGFFNRLRAGKENASNINIELNHYLESIGKSIKLSSIFDNMNIISTYLKHEYFICHQERKMGDKNETQSFVSEIEEESFQDEEPYESFSVIFGERENEFKKDLQEKGCDPSTMEIFETLTDYKIDYEDFIKFRKKVLLASVIARLNYRRKNPKVYRTELEKALITALGDMENDYKTIIEKIGQYKIPIGDDGLILDFSVKQFGIFFTREYWLTYPEENFDLYKQFVDYREVFEEVYGIPLNYPPKPAKNPHTAEKIPSKTLAEIKVSEEFFSSLTGKYNPEVIAFAQFLESNGEYLSPQDSKVEMQETGIISTSLARIIETSLMHHSTLSSSIGLGDFTHLLPKDGETKNHFHDIIAGVCIAQDEGSMYFLREGVQNARDALIASGLTENDIEIEYYARDGKFTSSIRDTGGMELSDVISKLLTPYSSGKKGENVTGKFGKGFFTFAVGCSELRIKTSTGNGKVHQIKMIPQLKDGIIYDFEVFIEEKNEAFKGTLIERVDELGGIQGNLRALVGTSLLRRYVGNTEGVPLRFGGNLLNDSKNKTLVSESPPLQDTDGKVLGTLRIYKTQDRSERFTKDNLWISEIKEDILGDFPDWIVDFIKDQNYSLDIPSKTPLVGSRNSLENREYYVHLFKPHIYKMIVEIVLREHVGGNLKIPMMPEDYFALLSYAQRGNGNMKILAQKYNTGERLSDSEIEELKNKASMAEFLTEVEFTHNGQRTSLRAIKKAIHENRIQKENFGGRFQERVTQALGQKERLNQRALKYNLSLSEITEITGLSKQEITAFKQFIQKLFTPVIQKRFGGKYTIGFHTNPSGGEIANSYGKGGFGCSFNVNALSFKNLVKNRNTPLVQEDIIDTIAHEMTHNEEDKFGTRKWGTHETDETHDASFMRINREILTELGRSI